MAGKNGKIVVFVAVSIQKRTNEMVQKKNDVDQSQRTSTLEETCCYGYGKRVAYSETSFLNLC